MNNSNGQYMDKPLPRNYEMQDEGIIYLEKSGLKEKLAQIPHPKLTKKQINSIRNCIIFLVILVVVIKIVDVATGSQSTARQFFKAKTIDANEEVVYDMLDLPEGKFMTKDLFLLVNHDWEKKDITNYEVLENELEGKDLWDEYSESESPDFIARHNVRYTVRGDSNLQQESFQLVKMDTFFPSWKVSTSDLVLQDVRITAPSNVTVTLDGIILGEEERLLYESDYYTGYDIYEVDIFAGEHIIDAEAEYMQSQTYTVNFNYSGASYEVPQLPIKGETQDLLEQTMIELLQDAYSAVHAGEGCYSLSEYFTDFGFEQFQSLYDNMVDSVYGYDDRSYENTVVSNFNFDEPYTYISSGTYRLNMDMIYDYSYDYTYTYYGWYDSEIRTEAINNDNSFYAEFVLIDGVWLVDEFYLNNIYY